jgi:uncharacterized SAM-binding protein YcdF (DUF218 family)
VFWFVLIVMFLWLSKLLPIFLYPSGLSCLLLGIAIATFWKRPRTAAYCLGTALAVLLIFSNAVMAQVLLHSLESQYPSLSPGTKGGAIVILGGCTKSPRAAQPLPEISESGDRIFYGAQLYRQGVASKVILSGGGISSWTGRSQSEAFEMATLLQFMGVPSQDLLLDAMSMNTYENAVNTQVLLRSQGISEPIFLVTSAFHLPRAMGIFQKQGMKAIAAPTDFLTAPPSRPRTWNSLLFDLLPDSGALDQVTLALKEYIGIAVYRAKGWL